MSAGVAADAGLERAAGAGIHRLALPTPFGIGDVNAYLIEDDPLTLVDTGPNHGTTLHALERGLAAHGRRIEDLELVVLSHQHVDHVGLVEVIVERSGADVAALDLLVPYLADYLAEWDADDQLAVDIMLRHGVMPELALQRRAIAKMIAGWGASAEITVPLRAGGELRLRDRVLRVHHRPGHSPSDTVLHDEAAGVVLAADHLILRQAPNPMLARPLDGSEASVERRPRTLTALIESLRATRAMEDADVVLSGHGEPIPELQPHIDDRLRLFARRGALIRSVLEREPRTAFDVARKLWGSVAVADPYVTMSEVLGHLDVLLDQGSVRELPEEDRVIFAPA